MKAESKTTEGRKKLSVGGLSIDSTITKVMLAYRCGRITQHDALRALGLTWSQYRVVEASHTTIGVGVVDYCTYDTRSLIDELAYEMGFVRPQMPQEGGNPTHEPQ
jgi:hypothetical protein